MAALPRASIEKMLRDVIPENIGLQKETIDWVAESATDFLRILGEKANAEAAASAKKEKYRVNADHVVKALQNMGKECYLNEIQANAEGPQEATKQKRQRIASRKAALKTASHEELLAEQNALFQEASHKATQQGW